MDRLCFFEHGHQDWTCIATCYPCRQQNTKVLRGKNWCLSDTNGLQASLDCILAYLLFISKAWKTKKRWCLAHFVTHHTPKSALETYWEVLPAICSCVSDIKVSNKQDHALFWSGVLVSLICGEQSLKTHWSVSVGTQRQSKERKWQRAQCHDLKVIGSR